MTDNSQNASINRRQVRNPIALRFVQATLPRVLSKNPHFQPRGHFT